MDPYLKDQDDVRVPIRGISEEYVGLNCYGRFDYLANLVGDGTAINAVLVQTRPGQHERAVSALDDKPGVTAVTSSRTMLEGFQQEIAELQTASAMLMRLFAGVMAFAVIYNAASININEQKRELACLRGLGYGREQVARVATGDIMPLGVLGVALGLAMGYLVMVGLARAYQTDIYRLPVVFKPQTHLAVAAWILIFQLLSRAFVARRAGNIDVVRELKSRE
jgi:putative ABC transport system permease protein